MQKVSSAIERCRLPARPRALLVELHRLGEQWFEQALRRALLAFERQLFQQADLASRSLEQQRCFDALRELKLHRDALWPEFHGEYTRLIAQLPERAGAAKAQANLTGTGSARLSMLAGGEMEETLALSEIATRAEMRHGQVLYQLGLRLGVLAGAPMLVPEANPFGPNALCQCLRRATEALKLGHEARIDFYRCVDREVFHGLDEYYTALNRSLVAAGVLPNTDFVAPRRAATVRAARPARDSAAAAVEPQAPPDASLQPPAAPSPPTKEPAAPRLAASELAAAPPAEEPAGSPEEFFQTLRELLAARRPRPVAQASGRGHVVQSHDVDAVLAMLQGVRSAPLMVAGRPVQRTIAHLRQELINHLRPLVPEGQVPMLPPEQSDALDLVGLLFDSLNRHNEGNPLGQDLLDRLQAPIARLALRDHSFFSQRNHPARKLMNLLAETSACWIEDPHADAALVQRLRSLVEQLARDFDGDPALFEQGALDLEQQLAVLKRKAELSERRHVDAARGRERLDLARQRSEAAIAGLIGQRKPSRLLRTLLEQAWTDVLALTVLRSGDDEAQIRPLLAIATRLLEADRGEGTRLPRELKPEVEQGLTSVGYHPADVDAITARLFDVERVDADDTVPTATELAVRLKARARLGQSPQTTGAARRIDPPLNAREQQQLQKLKQLPFGTWFEFTTNQQGDRVRRKLSWFSPLTLHCLFVNVRGVKALETDLEHIARDLERGQVRVLEEPTTGLIDRAWSTLLRTLRGLTQRDGVAEGA